MPVKSTKTHGAVRKRTLFKMEIDPSFHLGSVVTLRGDGVADASLSFFIRLIEPHDARRASIASKTAKKFCRELAKILKSGKPDPIREIWDGVSAWGTVMGKNGIALRFSFSSPEPGDNMHRFAERTLDFVESIFQDAEIKSYLQAVKPAFQL